MKVLWFTNTPANAQNYLNNTISGGGWLKILNEELEDKVDLHIAFHYLKKKDCFKYKNTTYHPIATSNFYLNAIKNIFQNSILGLNSLQDYIEIIDKVKPDIIHIHGTENPFCNIIPIINIPIVISIQGNMTVYHHKYFSGIPIKYSYSRPLTLDIKKLLYNKPYIAGYKELERRKFYEQKNLAHAKYIIGRTDWDRRIMSVLAKNAHYFHNDELLRGAFYNHKWENNFQENKLIIHTTTGVNFYKGFETICESAYILKNTLNINIEWRIAGINPTDYLVKLIRKKLGNRYPKNEIILLGNLNEDNLVKYLKESNIYVMASHIENSPNNLCEAMILGLPCISSFCGGTGSLIHDYEHGLLIQDGDPWVLAGAVKELFQNKELANKLGKNARELALKRHDKITVTNQLLNIYKNVSINK